MSEYVNIQLSRFNQSPLTELGIAVDDVRSIMRVLKSVVIKMSKKRAFLSDEDAYSTTMVGLGALLISKQNGNCPVKIDLSYGAFSYAHNNFVYTNAMQVPGSIIKMFRWFFPKYIKWLMTEGGFEGGVDEPGEVDETDTRAIEGPSGEVPDGVTPEEALEIAQIDKAYSECKSRLATQQLQVLTFVLSGISQTDIATILEVSGSTVSVLMRKARKLIRSCLESKDISMSDFELALPYLTEYTFN